MKQGALIFDETADRYDIRFDLANYYGGLHCGECMEVFAGGKWKPTRIEYGENWYLVGVRAEDLNGLRVRPTRKCGKQLFHRKKVLTRYCNCGKMRTKRNNVVAIQSRNKKAPRGRNSGGFCLIPYKNQAKCCAVVGLLPAQPLVEEI